MHADNRGDRRHQGSIVALRRKKSLGPDDTQPVGRFRKWNMTDRCPFCMHMRADQRKEVKAERRAGHEEERESLL